jgi:hypothetical protein
VEQQKTQELDRRAAAMEAFDSMNDESQIDALYMLQSIALACPRRSPVALRLVAASNDSFGLRESPSGSH